MAGPLKQADQVAEAEQRSGCRVMPIFQYRFGHGIQKLKFLVAQGIAGRAYLTTVKTAWRRRAAYYAVPWRARWATELGGPLVKLAIHAHDLVYYLLGPARSVSAHLTTLVNPIETEDCVAATLEIADGSLCTLSATTGSAREISRHRFGFANLSAESNTEPYRNASDLSGRSLATPRRSTSRSATPWRHSRPCPRTLLVSSLGSTGPSTPVPNSR